MPPYPAKIHLILPDSSSKISLARIPQLKHDFDFMHAYKHIIWDWNGTLLDDRQACVDAINMLLTRRHMPTVTLDQYLNVFDFPVRNYYLKLGFDFSRENWDDVAVEYHEAYALTSPSAPLRHSTKTALETLVGRGIGVSVLSACELNLLKRMMADRHIIHYFQHIYGLDDLYASSKVDLGHALLNHSGLSRKHTLMIGDTTHDHEVATAMGVACLLMTGGHQSEAKLTALGCPVVPDLKGVLDYVLRDGQG